MKKVDKDILAKKVYDTYCHEVGGRAFNGDSLPKSEDFFNDLNKQKQSNAWRKSLQPIYDMLLSATQNLGHPAYNISSSTTIGIDNLREKIFDYLEIPDEK